MIRVITGKNDFLIGREIHDYTEKFMQLHGGCVEKFDGNELIDSDDVLDAVRSISFLEPRKLVIVRNFGQSKELLNKLEYIIEQTADSTDLVLVDGKLDKRTAVYKYLQKNVEMHIFNVLAPYELEKWVTSEADKVGSRISLSDARFLIARVGDDQLRLKNEIDKLVLNGGEINRVLIEKLIDQTPQGKVFSMLDELFNGKADVAWRLYEDQRKQGEEPQKIIGMITWQLQQIAYAVFSPTKTETALKQAGVSPYAASNALRQAKSITKQNLKLFISQLAEIDMQSKTSADVESALAVYFSDVYRLRKAT